MVLHCKRGASLATEEPARPLACSLLCWSMSAVREAPAFSDRVRLRPGGHHREAAMATPTPKDTANIGRLEHEIAQVRSDLGRTVQEIGTRLTPARIMDQAKRSLRESTVEKTKAVAQSATDVAGDVASRTARCGTRCARSDAGASIRRRRGRRRYGGGLLAGDLGRCRTAGVSCRASGTNRSIGRAAGRRRRGTRACRS